MSSLTPDERCLALEVIAKPSTTPGVRRELQRALDASNPARVNAQQLEAAMARDPSVARFMRDLRLEAGAGCGDGGKFTIAEIDRALAEAAKTYPQHYGDSVSRISVKYSLMQAGAIAP